MALNVTPVHRNLHTRATFMGLEFEDLFVVLGFAAVMNVVSRFFTGTLGPLPISVALQYGAPLCVVPCLMVFKYGKPRGYIRDLAFWYVKPRAYCAMARDRQIAADYFRKEHD